MLPILVLVAFAAWRTIEWAAIWTRAAGAAEAAVRAERVQRPGVRAARATLTGGEARAAKVRVERGATGAAVVVVELPVPTIAGAGLTLRARSDP